MFINFLSLNPLPNKAVLLCVCSFKSFEISYIPFCHRVFTLFGECFTIFIKFEIVVCKLFKFGRVLNLLFGKGLRQVIWLFWIYQSPAWPIWMIIIVTGFISLSLLNLVLALVIWESSQWLWKNTVQSTGQKNSRKAWIGVLAATIWLEYCWKQH